MSAALDTLRQVFGYTAFRPPQDAIIDTLLAGEDALVIMPTGGGKSLCYQIPALLREGCGVVISPLIALMQDQVAALRQLGVRAAFLNSTLEPGEAAAVERALRAGELDLLYLAPERLRQERMLNLLDQSRLALFAIDEAHCVSQWGHDFRADYLELSLLHERFPEVPRIALTATADVRTRAEIAARLDLENARYFCAGFDRPNIRYGITLKDNPRQQLLRFLREQPRDSAGIVYCMSRQKTEDTAAWLCDQGYQALPYHAGLDARLRATHQARFLREDGLIMVATIAFGMGIDKPDVRFVVHLDMPKTIEAWYQETGRAGRDGQPATALLLYGLQDVIKLREMMASSQGSEEFKRAEQHRLNAMLGLCEVTTCRRQVLLRYFGENPEKPCGNCDTCLEPVPVSDGTVLAQKALSTVYRTGQRFGVNHLVDVLRGEETERVLQFEHHQLPVFGIGRDVDGKRWRSVFRQLVARNFLSVDLDRFGALRLEPGCRPLLRGEERIALREDPEPPRGRAGSASGRAVRAVALAGDIDPVLYDALRDCRMRLAQEQQVPPYVIFNNATLEDMCRLRPRSLDELVMCTGVGSRKLERYGKAFLEVLEAHFA